MTARHLVLAFMAVAMLGVLSEGRLNLLPLIIALIVLTQVLKDSTSRRGSRPLPPPHQRRLTGHPGSGQPAPPRDVAPPMPRIDVPQPPQGASPYAAPGTTAYPQGGRAGSSTDPVVSLARLQIGQLGRDLYAARWHGTREQVERILAELERQVAQHGSHPELGRELRPLGAAVGKARGEKQPGAATDEAVMLAARMGQDG